MAVIFAVVGGGAVVGIARTPSPGDSNYDDYEDYSDYDNYSDYGDAAERKRIRLENKKREINDKIYEINSYKINNVNEYLQSEHLKDKDGVSVSIDYVENDGNYKIFEQEKQDIHNESLLINSEIEEINNVIKKIDKILKENKS